MKRTLAVAVMFALVMTQLATVSAGTGVHGVIAGTMRGPAGPVSGVRVNVLDAKGTIVGTTVTNGAGSYSLSGLPAGTFMVQAVNATGSVMTTSMTTLATPAMKSTTNLTAAAATAQGGSQVSAATTGGFSVKTLWWVVGASAATAGLAATVALQDPASPVQ
jgi:hypothetical protein